MRFAHHYPRTVAGFVAWLVALIFACVVPVLAGYLFIAGVVGASAAFLRLESTHAHPHQD